METTNHHCPINVQRRIYCSITFCIGNPLAPSFPARTTYPKRPSVNTVPCRKKSAVLVSHNLAPIKRRKHIQILLNHPHDNQGRGTIDVHNIPSQQRNISHSLTKLLFPHNHQPAMQQNRLLPSF